MCRCTRFNLFFALIWGVIKGFFAVIGIALLSPSSVGKSQWNDLFNFTLCLVWGYFIIKPVIRYFKNKELTSIPENIKKREFAKEQIDKISEFLKNDCPVPSCYHELGVLNQFGKYLILGRADSLKECINLYHNELYKRDLVEAQVRRTAYERAHQDRVEAELQRQTDEMKKQTDELREQTMWIRRQD